MKFPLSFNFNPVHCLIFALLWSYGFVSSILPADFPPQIYSLAVSLLLLFVYKDFRISLEINREDLKALGILSALLFLSHWPTIFYSIGGDELWHAEKASVVLLKFNQLLLESGHFTTAADVQSSHWNLFDPRFLPVMDLWRILSIPCLAMMAAFIFGYRRIQKMPKWGSRTAATLALLALGYALTSTLWVNMDPHPPLRLLPLFVSELVLGLNNFAFRLPALLASVACSWTLYLFLSRNFTDSAFWFRVLLALSFSFLPPIFYSGEAVEANIYASLTALLLFIIIFEAFQKNKPDLLILAGIALALGNLSRQTTLFAWPILAVAYLLVLIRRPDRETLGLGLRTFAPILIALPNLYTALATHHPALVDTMSLSDKFSELFGGGFALMSILNSMTIPWMLLGVIAWGKTLWLPAFRPFSLALLVVIPYYILIYYLPLDVAIWGIGRYLADYLAPVVGVLIAVAAIRLHPTRRVFWAGVLVLLFSHTLEVNSNLSLDTNYKQWSMMRLTSSVNFPYDEALRYLKRQEVGPKFRLFGGSPSVLSMNLWLHGFGLQETAVWFARNSQMTAIARRPQATLSDLLQNLKQDPPDYIVLQTGLRRERLHRTPQITALIEHIQEAARTSQGGFYADKSFVGQHGGVLEIYRVKADEIK